MILIVLFFDPCLFGALLGISSQFLLSNLLDHLAFGAVQQQETARGLLPSLLAAVLVAAWCFERALLVWHDDRLSRIGLLECLGVAIGAVVTRTAFANLKS